MGTKDVALARSGSCLQRVRLPERSKPDSSPRRVGVQNDNVRELPAGTSIGLSVSALTVLAPAVPVIELHEESLEPPAEILESGIRVRRWQRESVIALRAVTQAFRE